MAYIGVQPADAYTSFAVQHFTTSATDTFTLDFPVANENEIALFINNVRQEPGSSYAYTASGTTLTLSSAITGSDSMYCVFIGKAVQTVTPASGSVTNDMLAGSIANAKLANSSITLNGSAVSLGGSATVGGTNTPAFEANRATDLTLTDNVTQKMTYDTEIFDTDGCYDATTNYRFTPTVAGKYYVYASLTVQGSAPSTLNLIFLEIHKNGTKYRGTMNNMNTNFITGLTPYVGTVIDMNGTTDYVEVYIRPDVSSGTVISNDADNVFGAYKIIE